jgi:transposase
MNIATLLAAPRELRVESIMVTTMGITVRATTVKAQAACPKCQACSRRVHSRYLRKVADLPWQGVAVRLELSVRRFFCRKGSCPQRIFCERMPALVAPHARRTVRLNTALQRVSFAVGGEAGARLASELAMATSPDTLLRRIRQAGLPPPPTPRVVGVDDWAKRKGQSYGTILVDLARRVPIELLPDREAETLQKWLQAHPGVEIISRDRAPKYAEGARTGAPRAVQVADRWHVLKNLGETLQRVLTRERASMEQAAGQLRDQQIRQPVVSSSFGSLLSSRGGTEIEQRRAHRYARYCAVKRLHQQGVSQAGIAHTLCMSPTTVRQFTRASTFPERAQYRCGSRLDPYLAYLHQRWAQGVRNPVQLWREVSSRGYPGTPRMLERYVTRMRQRLKGLTSQQSAHFLHGPTTFTTPSVRRLTAWVQKPQQDLTAEQRQFLTHLCVLSLDVSVVRELACAFRQLMKERAIAAFPTWLERAEQCAVVELRNFAVGLRQEYAAVAAALELPWSNGPVEGHVNRLKTIKRQMYGRANFDLLRARVLHAA